MPSKLRHRARAFLSRFKPIPHEPKIYTNNVHDLSRIGGVSVLVLPSDFAPCDLVIPTRFAATAQFLVECGMCSGITTTPAYILEGNRVFETTMLKKDVAFDVPGLFRIPGSKVMVGRLRAHFQRQMFEGEVGRQDGEVEFTVRLGLLPCQATVPYQAHDVASCFKSFLGDLEGGILGSVEIFEGLRKVVLPASSRSPRKRGDSVDLEFSCRGVDVDDAESDINPKNIARVISGIECASSRSLILAVFGLLAFFKAPELRDSFNVAEHIHNRNLSTSTYSQMEQVRSSLSLRLSNESRMTAESLGKIFAPLLLGETLLAQIKLVPFAASLSINTTNRASWTNTPYTHAAQRSPTKRTPNRIPLSSSTTNISLQITTPLLKHSAPNLLLRKENNRQSITTSHSTTSRPSHDFVRAEEKSRIGKKHARSKSVATFYDQQDRVLLVAKVMSLVLRQWEEVVVAYREAEFGRGRGRWEVERGECGGEKKITTLKGRLSHPPGRWGSDGRWVEDEGMDNWV